MRIKLYLLLPLDQAEKLVQDGFPDSSKRFRLNPGAYVACSAFNPKNLIEVVLELDRLELQSHRHELEMPVDEDCEADDEFGAVVAEPIYWYEFPASMLRKTCQSIRIITNRKE